MQKVWTIQKVLQWTVEHFRQKQVPEARLSAELLLAHSLKCKRLDLYLQFDRILTPQEREDFRRAVERRAKHEPVQYITGEQEFMGLSFKVSPAVLIPRPETELLVEHVLKEISHRTNQNVNILDVGTGSGAIAISIAHQCPDCAVTAVDLSPAAIEVAMENAGTLKTENVRFEVRDILNSPDVFTVRFDLIVSNPPYVAETERAKLQPQVTRYEPGEALFAGTEGMDFYRKFIPLLPKLLADAGSVYLEIGYDQDWKVKKLLDKAGLSQIEFIPDYQKINRIVKAYYEETESR